MAKAPGLSWIGVDKNRELPKIKWRTGEGVCPECGGLRIGLRGDPVTYVAFLDMLAKSEKIEMEGKCLNR